MACTWPPYIGDLAGITQWSRNAPRSPAGATDRECHGLTAQTRPMLANLEEWGGYCAPVAEALVTRYDLAERAVGFFRFFAAPAPGFTEQATSVVAAELAAGEDPQEAGQAARALHAYKITFWDALAAGLD